MTLPAIRFDAATAPVEHKGAKIIPLARPGCPTTAHRRSELTEAAFDRLNRLRWLALKSRLQPKPDIERACYLLAADGHRVLEPVANAFFRGLDRHGTMPIELYRPGTRKPSNDEIWMLRLLAAFEEGRESEGAALVIWRVEACGRRWMRFLSAALAELLSASDTDERQPTSSEKRAGRRAGGR